MTTYATRGCDCPDIVTGTRGRRPESCECGNHYLTAAQLRKLHPAPADEGDLGIRRPGRPVADPSDGGASKAGRRRRPMRRSEPKRDWSLARAKVEEEDFCCRVCGAPGAEAAHVLGRKFDQPISPRSKTLLVLPDRIIPLCNEEMGQGCHVAYDTHVLDLLPFLRTAEQAQAVLDAGSIGQALKRISPEGVRV